VDTDSDTLRTWALYLAAQGRHVFPITPGAKKPPVIDRWENRASTDPDQIRRWWREVPYTIGIATGPSGLVVVDLDTRKPGETVAGPLARLGIHSGATALRALARQHHTTVTPTYTVSTPSGGWHLYYTAPPGAPLRNTQGLIGWSIICCQSWFLLVSGLYRGEACKARRAGGIGSPGSPCLVAISCGCAGRRRVWGELW